MTVDDYDTQFVRLLRYAPHMIPDEQEKIRRFVLGLRLHLCQFVSMQMELYPSYMAAVDVARMAEMNEKGEDDDSKRKRRRGSEWRTSSYGGPFRASRPPRHLQHQPHRLLED